MQMNLLRHRRFSSQGGGPEEKPEGSGNQYESGFESLMKGGKVTKEESEQFRKRREERAAQAKAE
jgi:hypothetical protein